MKKLNIAAKTGFVAVLLALAAPSFAQTADADVDVKVTLTSKCKAQSTTAAVVSFGTYVAFQTTAQPATPVTVNFECTRGLSGPTFSWDGATAFGVVAGLNYELTTTPDAVAPGTAATAVSGGTGSADVWGVSVGGSMPADQAGADSTGVQTDSRVLTITF